MYVECLDSILGMQPQITPAEDMGNITENNLVIRALHGSADMHVDVIGFSLITRTGVTS